MFQLLNFNYFLNEKQFVCFFGSYVEINFYFRIFNHRNIDHDNLEDTKRDVIYGLPLRSVFLNRGAVEPLGAVEISELKLEFTSKLHLRVLQSC